MWSVDPRGVSEAFIRSPWRLNCWHKNAKTSPAFFVVLYFNWWFLKPVYRTAGSHQFSSHQTQQYDWSLCCSTPIVHNTVVVTMPILLQSVFEEVKLLTFYEISSLNTYHLQIRVTEREACVDCWSLACAGCQRSNSGACWASHFFFSKESFLRENFHLTRFWYLKPFLM